MIERQRLRLHSRLKLTLLEWHGLLDSRLELAGLKLALLEWRGLLDSRLELAGLKLARLRWVKRILLKR